jgi:hypothetical protein
MIIKPTVGRVLHFWPHKAARGEQPLAAMVAYVWNDYMVNLMVIDRNGRTSHHTSVTLVQFQDAMLVVANEGPYCEWPARSA